MPQAIPGIILAAKAVGIYVLKAIAVAAVAQTVSKYEAKRLEKDPRAAPRDVSTKSTTGPQTVVYGKAMVSGLLSYANTIHPGVDQGHELHQVLVHACHSCEDILDINLDGTILEGGVELDWTTHAVVSGDYDPDQRTDKEAVKVWKYLGSQTTPPTELASEYPSLFTSAHVGAGLTYTVWRFKLTTKSQKLWAPGNPQVVRVLMLGKDDIYDPRLDTSPGAHPTNLTYAAYTDNPILIAADYVRSFVGFSDSEIDWDSIATEATVCDALVAIPGSLTEKRYVCGGMLSLGDEHGKNIAAILDTCLGTPRYVAGKFSVLAGAYHSPTLDLGVDDIMFPFSVQGSPDKDERFNTVKGIFVDAGSNYLEKEFLPQSSSVYIARDNGKVLEKSLSLSMVTGEFQAQRIAWKMNNLGNQMRGMTLPTNYKGLSAAPGDRVNVALPEFGYNPKVFRVVTDKINGERAPVELVLREDSSSAWADPAAGDYNTRTASGAIVPANPDAIPPQNIVLTPLVGGIRVSFDIPEQPLPVTGYRFYTSDTSAWSGATAIWQGLADHFDYATLTQKWFWGVAVVGDINGLRNPDSDTSSLTATPFVDRGRFSIGAPVMEDFSDGDSARAASRWVNYYNNGNEAVVAETGTPPPSGGQYVWQFGNNSGDDSFFKYQKADLAMPVDLNVLYRVTWAIRRTAGAGLFYAGVVGWKADRSDTVDQASGASPFSSSIPWVCASGTNPGNTAWHTYVGYVMKTGGSPTGAGASPEDPMILHNNTQFISLAVACNQPSSTAGTSQLAYGSIERVSGIGEIPTDSIGPGAATAVYTAFDAGVDSYNSGTVPNPYISATVTGGMDSDSAVIVTLTTDLKLTSAGGTKGQVYFLVDWGSSVQSDIAENFDSGAVRRMTVQKSWTTATIPANTTFTVNVRLGSPGSSTIDMSNTNLTVEIVKR